jgi:hypothetical protein
MNVLASLARPSLRLPVTPATLLQLSPSSFADENARGTQEARSAADQ